MKNIGVRAEHMTSTVTVYQKVRIQISIFSGMRQSIVSTSLPKRFNKRPDGLASKKACGALRTAPSMWRWVKWAAFSIP